MIDSYVPTFIRLQLNMTIPPHVVAMSRININDQATARGAHSEPRYLEEANLGSSSLARGNEYYGDLYSE